MKPSDQLRRIITRCGMSRYRLARETGVSEAALSRFIHGQTALGTDAIDRLATVLEIAIVSRRDQGP